MIISQQNVHKDKKKKTTDFFDLRAESETIRATAIDEHLSSLHTQNVNEILPTE